MKLVSLKLVRRLAILHLLGAGQAMGAQGEMGIGIPEFGIYGGAVGAQAIVWILNDAAAPFPTGCTSLTLTPATMGLDTYKISVAMLMVAKASNRRVRFYAHAVRDGGCGVDYVQLM